MMPNDSLSQVAIKYSWSGLDVNDPDVLTDYDEGGVDLNNISNGRSGYLWTFSAADIYITCYNEVNAHLLFTEPNNSPIQSVRGTFDQNMQAHIAYQSGDQWHWRWWDSVNSVFTTTDLPISITSCACTLDDLRMWNATNSDVLLFYVLNGNLYQRRQRDRYATEMLVRTGAGGEIVKVDMNGINRLQFKMKVK